MALRAKVLQKKAEKFELKKLQLVEVTKEGVSTLDTLLQDVYANRRPKPTDYEVRKDLIRVFNEIAREVYGTSKDIPVVVEFGSFVMDLFSNTSDLDLSINFSTGGVDFPREKKIQTLRKFARKLYAIQGMGHISGVLPITTAKVPILKCVDRGTGVECDISVENRDGISKSQIIRIISSIDERFKKLSFLMKTWAKSYNINSSKDRTLNSLSIILLVAFHLQTRNPPILPPFCAIFRDGTDPEMVAKSMSNFVNYGKRNRESLAELFITLLLKLSSVEILWAKGLCASTYTASWTSKSWDSKVACISVEDFSDISQNVARAVGPTEAKQIYKCINISIGYITSLMGRKIGVEVKDLLFGVDGKGMTNLNVIAPFPHIYPPQANQTRGMVGGKRKKSMQVGSFHKKRNIDMESRVKGKQVQQQTVVVETSVAKRIHTVGRDEGVRGTVDGWCTAAAAAVGTSTESGRWGETCAVGWGRSKQGAAAGLVWEEAYNARGGGWGVSEQNRWGNWGATQQGGGWGGGDHLQKQHESQGWGGEIHHHHQHDSQGWGGGGGGWEGSRQAYNGVGAWGWRS